MAQISITIEGLIAIIDSNGTPKEAKELAIKKLIQLLKTNI